MSHSEAIEIRSAGKALTVEDHRMLSRVKFFVNRRSDFPAIHIEHLEHRSATRTFGYCKTNGRGWIKRIGIVLSEHKLPDEALALDTGESIVGDDYRLAKVH